MKNFEFKSWVEFVKTAFPNFNPTASQLMMEAWQRVLKFYSLEEAKNAVTQYVAEKSSKYEPQPKELAEILKNNKSHKVENEPIGEIKEDEAYVRFHQDIELGIARHNLYVYRLAYPKVLEGMEWKEALEQACLEKLGILAEYPSNEELKAKGIDPHSKVAIEDAKKLLDIFIKKGCQL